MKPAQKPFQILKLPTDPKEIAVLMEKSKKELLKKFGSYLEGEFYLDRFTCSLQTKVLLSGRLHVTNKRVLFRSLFNEKTIFGKSTKIIMLLDDITWIEKRCYNDMKIFPNSILIRVSSPEPRNYFFTSMLKNGRKESYELIKSMLTNLTPPTEGSTVLVTSSDTSSSKSGGHT